MPLILRAVSLNDVPLTQPISARFEAGGGTIGRADSNTMSLPDPERHISRQQAQVTATPNGFVIRNIGAANPILVRNQRLMQGEVAPLSGRDQVRVGGYLLEVIEEVVVDDEATKITRAVPAPRPVADPFGAPGSSRQAMDARGPSSIADFNAPLSDANPFADLLGAAAAPPVRPAAAPVPARPTAGVSKPGVNGGQLLPEDFDPFADPPPARPAAPSPAEGSSPFAGLIPTGAEASLDDLFGLGRPGARDALADFANEAHAPAPVARVEPPSPSTDPLAMFAPPGAPARATPAAFGESDHVPELRAAFAPPKPLAATGRPPVAPARSIEQDFAERDVRPARDDGDLWSAFCEGARLRVERPRDLDAETMRMLGALVRATVEGTLQLMEVRKATRHELHAQVTVIRPRDNNPLKFSPDVQSALEQLLQPPLRGFLPAPAAMTDAMNDLVGHAIGSMAGTRAALEGVLERFAPTALEQKLVGGSVLDNVLSMSRKARLWQLYLKHYDEIREEAHEDFHALFGKAFLSAYEEQLDRLHQVKKSSAAD